MLRDGRYGPFIGCSSYPWCDWTRSVTWVLGDGPYAVIEPCGVLTIERFEQSEEAEERLRVVEEFGCRSAACSEGAHWLVDLRTGERIGRRAA